MQNWSTYDIIFVFPSLFHIPANARSDQENKISEKIMANLPDIVNTSFALVSHKNKLKVIISQL